LAFILVRIDVQPTVKGDHVAGSADPSHNRPYTKLLSGKSRFNSKIVIPWAGDHMMEAIGRYILKRPAWVAALVVLAIALLPLAVWLDLRNLSDQNLKVQAAMLNKMITSVRGYYASNVIDRVKANGGTAHPANNYSDIDGGIPIPATLSIELGEAFGGTQSAIKYRFVSPYTFKSRAPHIMSPFEKAAFNSFKSGAGASQQMLNTNGNLRDRSATLAVPVIMGGACISCHNSHPESPKTDWRVGDVRGIQAITVHQQVALNIWAFKWLLAYMTIAGVIGLLFVIVQFRLARTFQGMNAELEANNSFLADVSLKISKYLSPQIYRSIFAGEKDVSISTERKKLTVFFSDIKDFTATTERLQPEELTGLLNEYFTEMSQIAHAHGATIDKFIGDAIVAFFGDPTTRGVTEDARACVRMALDMQRRLVELNTEWRQRGYEHPFQARIGINTGYCNVGNFGSDERMDYTIIGAEANLAARMEGIAKPGGIVMSYETWAHVQDMAKGRALAPTSFKGVAREVVPIELEISDGTLDPAEEDTQSIREAIPGVDININLNGLDANAANAARAALKRALENLGTPEPKSANS
jgi:adenylate cyclase